MKTNKEKFLKLVTGDGSETREWMLESYRKRNFLKASHKISINIRKRLKELNMSQKELAEKMGKKEQQVSKWAKGGVNYTLETLLELGDALDMELIRINSFSSLEINDYKETDIDIVAESRQEFGKSTGKQNKKKS